MHGSGVVQSAVVSWVMTGGSRLETPRAVCCLSFWKPLEEEAQLGGERENRVPKSSYGSRICKYIWMCSQGCAQSGSSKISRCQKSVKKIPNDKPSKNCLGGGLHTTDVAFLLLTQWPWVQFSAFPKHYFDVAQIYQRWWWEESGQRLENVDWTQLVLASSKLAIQKIVQAGTGRWN